MNKNLISIINQVQVIKRNGSKENVSFDKILNRIESIRIKLNLDRINTVEIAKETIQGLHDGMTTEELDFFASQRCSASIIDDPQYDKLAAGIYISNIQKTTSDDFMYVTELLYNNKDIKGKDSPLVTEQYYNTTKKHIDIINATIDYDRDFLFDFFGIKTLEKAYLIRLKKPQDILIDDKSNQEIHNIRKYGRVVERPQHLFMRVAIGIHGDNIKKILNTYELMSNHYFTHASPTLYNAGSYRAQMSSCFLMGMDDNLKNIFETLGNAAEISKWAGGIGINLSDIRAKGSMIAGTNGVSDGIIPLARHINTLARYINQGGKRNGAIACFCENTEVFTANNGVKKIQDVKIGDLVVTHKSRLRPVVQVHKNLLNDRKIYKLTVEKNKDIYVTGNHRFWSFYTKECKYNKLSLGWNSIQELKEIIDKKETTRQTCYVYIPSGTNIQELKDNKIDVMDFKNIIYNDGIINELKLVDNNKIVSCTNTIGINGNNNVSVGQSINKIWNITEDFANLIGIWLGNGHLRKLHTGGKVLGIGFTIHTINIKEIDYIKKVCNDIFGCKISEYTCKTRNVTQLAINSRMIGLIFKELFGCYFNGKRLPDMIFNWPKNLINSLMAGLITTDGHITKKKYNATLTLSNKNLINQLYHLCRNNGIDVSFVKNKITKGQTCCSYTINLPLNLEILNQTYKYYEDDRVDKCRKRLEEGSGFKKNGFLKILNITETDRTDEYVYTLGVEEDHSYTVEGLVCENCYIEPWHFDVFEFCALRNPHGSEELRARDIFLGLWIPDLFMKRVRDSGIWSLMCPHECPGLTSCYGEEFEKLYEQYESQGKFIQQIEAKILWYHILECQTLAGTPYMLYKDSCNHKSNQKNYGILKNSNLCAEIVQYCDSNEYAVCNLASICLPKFVENNNGEQIFNFQKLIQVAETCTENLDNIIDINYYPVEQARRSNMKHRPIGLGVQGLADVFYKMEIPFDSAEAQILNKKIFESIYYGAVKASNNLAKIKGKYETFEGSPYSKGLLQFHLWGLTEDQLLMDFDWKTLIEDIKVNGMRNSLLTAIMPTASTSQIMNNTECIEPKTTNLFLRSTIAGEYIVVNHYLIEKLVQLKLWNKQTLNELIFDNGSIQNISAIPQNIKNIFKTAFDLKTKPLLDLAIGRGPFIDQTQSMNIFSAKPDFDMLTKSHFYGWKSGLKTGMYYLRSQPTVNPIKFGMDPETIKDICARRGIEDIKIEDLKKNTKTVSDTTPECELCSG